MPNWTQVATFALVIISILGLAGVVYFSFKPSQQDNSEVIRQRIARLKDRVEQTRKATPAYSPKIAGKIDDLSVPAPDLLRDLPGIAEVEVLVSAKNPTHRIIHIRDWHTVPKDLFTLDMKEAHKRSLSQAEIDLLHQELLFEAELVQLEQVAMLRCLVKHHGLKGVFSEGLTKGNEQVYRDKVAALRGIEGGLSKQLDEVRRLAKSSKAQAIEKEIAGLLDQYRLDVLELGSPGKLMIAGDIQEVLPLDDADLLERAKPISPDGRVQPDSEKIQLRRDGQVKIALQHGPFALIVLGGSHDLSDSVRRLGQGTCEYIRVTTKCYQEIAK